MKEYFFTDEKFLSNIQILGRYEKLDEGVTFDWCASSIRFLVKGGGKVSLTLAFSKSHERQVFECQIYTVFFDDQRAYEVEWKDVQDGDQREISFEIPKEKELCEVLISRDKERRLGNALLVSLQLEGELLKTEQRPLLVEFVGDSVTCAGVSSYAFLTVQNLKVDHRFVSNGGWGIKYNSSGDTGPFGAWVHAYEFENNYRNPDKRLNQHRKADIVCINLGTNDTCARQVNHIQFTDDELAEHGVTLTNEVLRYNKDAKIVWLYGGINYRNREIVKLIAKKLSERKIEAYIADLGGQYESGYAWHPSKEEHVLMANTLTKWLRENLIVGGNSN